MRGASAVLSRKRGFDVEQLLPPQQAIITFLSRAALSPPTPETVVLDDAFGRVLARDVVADRPYPEAARSTMDGYAIRASDVPATLDVVSDIAIGRKPSVVLSHRQAARIPTGGLLPCGADAVVPFERVEDHVDTIVVEENVLAGDCLTERGEDIKEGERLLSRGQRIGPAEVGVLATLGYANVEVFRQPQLAVISSGDELVAVSAAPAPGQVRDSNRYAIAAALLAMGARVTHFPTARDEDGELEPLLRQALAENDGIFLSGGSSVGERDRTPAAIAALGKPGVLVHGLRVKPGKPTVLAAIEGKPIIGLPGNPTSALMILETIGAPIVSALTGEHSIDGARDAELQEAVDTRAGWTWFVPVTLSHDSLRLQARPLPLRSSLTTLCARAAGFIIVDEETERVERGEVVRVYPFTKA